MGSFSIWHWLIVLAIVLLIFGTKKLRNMGSDLGGAVTGRTFVPDSVGAIAPAMRQRGQSPPGAAASRGVPQEVQSWGSLFMLRDSCCVCGEWLHKFCGDG